MGITLEGGMTAVPLQFFAHYPLTRGTRTYTQGKPFPRPDCRTALRFTALRRSTAPTLSEKSGKVTLARYVFKILRKHYTTFPKKLQQKFY